MEVVCCNCGETYQYERSTDVAIETIDLKDGNVADRIKCPHCGLEHLVIWVKIGRKEG